MEPLPQIIQLVKVVAGIRTYFSRVPKPMTLTMMLVYSFPMASVTNHRKLRGLKQGRFIPLQFWESEV